MWCQMRTRLHLTMMAPALAALAVAALAVAALAAAGPVLATATGRVPDTAGGTQLWNTIGDQIHQGSATAMVTSPDGHAVFVTGNIIGTPTVGEPLTIAYNASTGTKLWARRYVNPDGFASAASAMAISPDGSVLFVTGQGERATSGDAFTTIAYNASTGKQLWTALYNGPSDRSDEATAITVAPDGQTVFVSGNGAEPGSNVECETVAYKVATGTQVWARSYRPQGSTSDCSVSGTVAAAPGGSTVFVGATTYTQAAGIETEPVGQNFATIAYDAKTGATRWVSKYNGPGNGGDTLTGLGVGQGGGLVFVAGPSQGVKSNLDYATIAYAAATGRQVWIARYNGPANRADAATGLAVGLGGKLVIVTGSSKGKTSGPDYATVAYAASTGRQAWVSRYDGPGNMADLPSGIAVGSGGRTVFVTGLSITSERRKNFATVSYNAATGAQRWAARFAGPEGRAQPGPIAASPAGGQVFVAGFAAQSHGRLNLFQLIDTVAYQA